MEALCAAHPDIATIRRIITRPEALGGEDFDGATDATFDTHIAAGDFALHWSAHGLRYGIPCSELEILRRGDAVINLSRRVLFQASQLADLRVFNLTAPVEVLAERLAARGRESASDVAARLKRAHYEIDPRVMAKDVANDGPLDDTVATIGRALYGATGTDSGMRCNA